MEISRFTPAVVYDTTESLTGLLKVREIVYNTLGPSSVTVVEIDGVNQLMKNKECTARYFVFDGAGNFRLENEEGELENYAVRAGDVVVIPPGVAFQDSGRMTLIAIYTPPFDPDQVKALDVNDYQLVG